MVGPLLFLQEQLGQAFATNGTVDKENNDQSYEQPKNVPKLPDALPA
jgi:hypothetical protein